MREVHFSCFQNSSFTLGDKSKSCQVTVFVLGLLGTGGIVLVGLGAFSTLPSSSIPSGLALTGISVGVLFALYLCQKNVSKNKEGKEIFLASEENRVIKRIKNDFRDEGGNTSLHLAALSGDRLTVKLLLDTEHDPIVLNCQNKDGDTPLHLARTKEVACILLSHGASQSIENHQNLRPIENALQLKKSAEVLKSLSESLSFKEKWEILDRFFLNPFTTSEMVAKYLFTDDEMKRGDENGRTVLMHAYLAGDLDLATKFLNRGANPNARDINGQTILHLAILPSVKTKGISSEIREFLVTCQSKGLNFNGHDSFGRTALHYACEKGDIETARFLESTIYSNKDNEGNTPLHLLCSSDTDFGNFNLFLAQLPDFLFNVQNNLGETCLHVLIRKYQKSMPENALKAVASLLDFGVDWKVCDINNRNALQLACLYEIKALLEFFYDKLKNYLLYLFPFAIEEKKCAVIKDLIARDVLLDASLPYNSHLLELALAKGYLPTIALLMDEIASGSSLLYETDLQKIAQSSGVHDEILKIVDGELLLSLLQVAERGLLDGIDFYLKAGLNPQDCLTLEKNPDTVLHIAAQSNHPKVLEICLPYFDKVDLLNDEGENPFHLAIIHGSEEAADLLHERKELLHSLSNGFSCLHLAVMNSHVNLAFRLVEWGVDGTILDSNHKYYWHYFKTEKEILAFKKMLEEKGSKDLADQIDLTRWPNDLFSLLPKDVSKYIVSFVSEEDIAKISETSKTLYKLTKENTLSNDDPSSATEDDIDYIERICELLKNSNIRVKKALELISIGVNSIQKNLAFLDSKPWKDALYELMSFYRESMEDLHSVYKDLQLVEEAISSGSKPEGSFGDPLDFEKGETDLIESITHMQENLQKLESIMDSPGDSQNDQVQILHALNSDASFRIQVLAKYLKYIVYQY